MGKNIRVFVVEGLTTNILPTNEATLLIPLPVVKKFSCVRVCVPRCQLHCMA